MLQDKEIDALVDVFHTRIQKIVDEHLKDMGRHISKIGTLLPSDLNRIVEMRRINTNMQLVRQKLSSYSKKSLGDIAKIFVAVAQSDARFMEENFEQEANTESLHRIIEAQLQVTYGAMQNLSRTTISSASYRNAVDAAITAVESGTDDYNSAIRRALRDAAINSLTVQYPSGVKRRIDSAIRQNVMDGIKSINQQVLYNIGDEFGANGVEISAHALCAEDHLPYQGRQFDADTFREIQSTLRRPFGMWNCRHTIFLVV